MHSDYIQPGLQSIEVALGFASRALALTPAFRPCLMPGDTMVDLIALSAGTLRGTEFTRLDATDHRRTPSRHDLSPLIEDVAIQLLEAEGFKYCAKSSTLDSNFLVRVGPCLPDDISNHALLATQDRLNAHIKRILSKAAPHVL